MADTRIGRIWLALPWAILALGLPLIAWWLLEPVPVTITYVAPMFLSRPAINRADAATAFVSEVKGGSTVFRYVSYCVSRPFEGTNRRAWVGEALVWHAPDLPTMLSRTPGCYDANIAVTVPTSSPTRSFMYRQELFVSLNPLRSVSIQYSPIPLTILDNKQ